KGSSDSSFLRQSGVSANRLPVAIRRITARVLIRFFISFVVCQRFLDGQAGLHHSRSPGKSRNSCHPGVRANSRTPDQSNQPSLREGTTQSGEIRGLKSTATIMSSLRERNQN